MFGKYKKLREENDALRDKVFNLSNDLNNRERELVNMKSSIEELMDEKGWGVCPICGKRDEMKWEGDMYNTGGVWGKIKCERCNVSVYGEMKVVRAKWNKLRREE